MVGVPRGHVCTARSAGKITLHDLKRCKMANVFYDTFFNIEKYLEHEQKEQASLLRVRGAGGRRGAVRGRGAWAAPRDTRVPQETESEGPELSDWEKYAAEEYDILVAEEAAGEPWEDA